jgi:hypothetical protein
MGGLVTRSAIHAATEAGLRWPKKLRTVVFLGTPHQGAPLERGGHWLDVLLTVSPYSAPIARLGKIRSAGITDLRHGSVVDADWAGLDRFGHVRVRRTPVPLPEGVACYAIAATRALQTTAARLPSDGIVPVQSALGHHDDPAYALRFPPSHQWIAAATGHVDLLGRPEVYEQLRTWLTP